MQIIKNTEKTFEKLFHLLLILLSLTALIPFVVVISSSLSDEMLLATEGYGIFPKGFNLDAYRFILESPERILNAYGVTLFITSIGTFLAIIIMTLMAYAISRPQFWLKRFFAIFILIPMLFNGGLVPYYILITRYLRLQNTIIVLILPQLVGLYQMILLRTYLKSLPEELFEAARVDGAGEWRIVASLVFHLAKPAISTIALMIGIAYWNNWTTALYFIRDWRLYPLQYLLYQVMEDAEILALEPQLGGIPLPLQSTRMAMAVLATGPAALAFLFVQKYLVRGITLGSLK